ncbi:MAG: acyl-CoA dehydrogenase family protein [Sphingomonadales bacterium]|nr:acyl-CoA dehydrogenase family protein [Sphingomonadales bacterium]
MIDLEMDLTPEDEQFRQEVRTFLEESFTPDLREEARRQTGVFAHGDLAQRWHHILYERGWIAPTWPREFGGAGFSHTQQYLFSVECAEAGTPTLPLFGLQMCGPVIMRYGTPEQREFFLPRILSGEHYWCQGYSEPQAGSDLAAVRCRAIPDGEHYVVNGQKIWTTHAHFANWIFMLVRTGTEGAPQAGISFILVPMDTPGITVRPILSMSGEHEVNEVFFDDVRVPLANLVGEENKGWSVAKFLLLNERGGSSAVAPLKSAMSRLSNMLEPGSGRFTEALRSSSFRRSLAELEIDMLAIEVTERIGVAAVASGAANLDDAMASIQKLRVTETLQKITELTVEAIGPCALADQSHALFGDGGEGVIGPDAALTPVAQYLNMRACTIFGGSSEIQRNILARVALGL